MSAALWIARAVLGCIKRRMICSISVFVLSCAIFAGCSSPNESGSPQPLIPQDTYTFNGTILSTSDSTSVEHAVVWIDNPYTNELFSYSATNSQGKFSLRASRNVATKVPSTDSALELVISKEGFLPKRIPLRLFVDTVVTDSVYFGEWAIMPTTNDTVKPFVLAIVPDYVLGNNLRVTIVFSKNINFSIAKNLGVENVFGLVSYSFPGISCAGVPPDTESSRSAQDVSYFEAGNVLEVDHPSSETATCYSGTAGNEVSYPSSADWQVESVLVQGFEDTFGNVVIPTHWPQ